MKEDDEKNIRVQKLEATLEAVQYAYKMWIGDTTSPKEFKEIQVDKWKNEIDFLQKELKKLNTKENED